MTIVLAPDKYKGSISGLEFCDIVAPILQKELNANIIRLPLADGGDGTIEVVNYYLDGDIVEASVNNPLFQPVKASYLYSKTNKVAFIEMAEASGLKCLKPEAYNCMQATTYGTGELILNAINKGAKHIILGIGGSATNDCGIGMASALGYKFYDNNSSLVKPIGANLSAITTIDATKVDTRLRTVTFQIACDVTNPLYGSNGAAQIYAKQKGASDKDIEVLDAGLQSFSKVLDHQFNIASQQIKGAGAAGGMGAAALTFLNGQLLPGIELIKQIADFDSKIKNTDWIITGEGKLDAQTQSGKALSGVLASAKANHIKVAAFCGAIDLSPSEMKAIGIAYADAIMNRAKDFKDALANTPRYLQEITQDFANKIKDN